MPYEDKETYSALNAAEKVRYENKKRKEIADNGFFILADGYKSTEAKNIPKRK
jgi:hypothetical protein